MPLPGFLSILKRFWWAVLVGAVLAAVPAYYVAASLPAAYDGVARVLVGPTSAGIDELRASAQLVPTYVELARGENVLQAAAAEVGISLPTQDLRDAVRVTGNPGTRVITIEATRPDAEGSVRLASAIAGQLAEQTAATGPGAVAQIDTTTPTEPSSPRVVIVVSLAALAGAFAALLVLALIHVLFDPVTGVDRLVAGAGVPVLGDVKAGREPLGPLLARTAKGQAPVHRLLAARTGLLGGDARTMGAIRRLLVVAPAVASRSLAPSSVVAANLAVAAADAGRRVVLIDACRGQDGLSVWLGMDDAPGLGELLDGRQAVPELRGRSGVYLLSSGQHGRSEAVKGDLDDLLDQLGSQADTVIIDADPIELATATAAWAAAADAALVVVPRDRVSMRAVNDSVAALGALMPGRPVQCVLLHETRARRQIAPRSSSDVPAVEVRRPQDRLPARSRRRDVLPPDPVGARGE